jgi:hypothetical protein
VPLPFCEALTECQFAGFSLCLPSFFPFNPLSSAKGEAAHSALYVDKIIRIGIVDCDGKLCGRIQAKNDTNFTLEKE